MTAVIDRLERPRPLARGSPRPAADATPGIPLAAARTVALRSPQPRARAATSCPVSTTTTQAAAAVQKEKQRGEGSRPRGGKRTAPEAVRGAVGCGLPQVSLEKIRDALGESSRAHPQTHTVWVWGDGRIEGAKGHPGRAGGAVGDAGGARSDDERVAPKAFSRLSGSSRAAHAADAEGVPALFSDGFSRCLLNNLAKTRQLPARRRGRLPGRRK